MNEIEVNSKPRRAQGGMGLLSRSISVQKLKNPSLREEREEEQRGQEEGAWEMRGRWSGLLGARREGERRGVRGFLTPTTLNPKD